ncbi:metal-dependent hydrolase [Solitalea longa]|uniref:Metal-dependent hydrolase n=1 Tax=Solitalea longa TaxID=2079460 RepID=A0A2S5A2L7_9SPHI|nr:SprT family zinc-dependent metalloprotease [Solitalea longa]POY36785.1 metal-dependent hydrolase [Solitalea longa]
MKSESLKIGAVEIEVTFKPIKNLHLSVHPPEGRVTISSPEFYNLEKVKIYAATKLGWIKKEQQKFQEQKREQPRLYINRESHFIFGSRYLLYIELASKNTVEIKGKKLVLNVTDANDLQLKKNTLYRFYRNQLRQKLNGFVEYYAPIMGLSVPEFKIRAMKTKWGSCATDTKRLWFNIELAKKPLETIEYIVVHEMVHLLERNHNKNFILLMDHYLPNWRIQKKVLNELPL